MTVFDPTLNTGDPKVTRKLSPAKILFAEVYVKVKVVERPVIVLLSVYFGFIVPTKPTRSFYGNRLFYEDSTLSSSDVKVLK